MKVTNKIVLEVTDVPNARWTRKLLHQLGFSTYFVANGMWGGDDLLFADEGEGIVVEIPRSGEYILFTDELGETSKQYWLDDSQLFIVGIANSRL